MIPLAPEPSVRIFKLVPSKNTLASEPTPRTKAPAAAAEPSTSKAKIPPVVILEVPLSIVPNPEVIEPELTAPNTTNLAPSPEVEPSCV